MERFVWFFLIWGIYARFAKKDVGLFATHSFTEPTLMRNGSKAVQEQTDRISSTEPEPPTGSACQGRTSFCWQIMSPSSRTVWAAFWNLKKITSFRKSWRLVRYILSLDKAASRALGWIDMLKSLYDNHSILV